MKRAIRVALGIATIVSSAAAFSIGAGDVGSLTQDQYVATQRTIAASRAAQLSSCESLAAPARDFCRVEADADQSVRLADAEAAFRRTLQASRAAQRARIEARYQSERARCAILGGMKRDNCMVLVHASRGRALLDVAAPYEVRS